MTAFIFLAVMIPLVSIYASRTSDGDTAARSGVTNLPPTGFARFFYLIGYRVHMRATQP